PGVRAHRNENAPVALGCKFDAAVDPCKERVVDAHPDIRTRVPLRAALTCQDVAGKHLLAAVPLDAETAPCGVAPVARGASGFLVCHDLVLDGCSAASGGNDVLDAHGRLLLAMPTFAPRILAPALLEGDDLGGAP